MQYTKGAPDEVLQPLHALMRRTARHCPLTRGSPRRDPGRRTRPWPTKPCACCAAASANGPSSRRIPRPEALEQGLTFLGLTGMIDPIRPEVKAAIAECRTGRHPSQ